MEGLRRTLERRASPYKGAVDRMDAEPDEIMRFNRLAARVRVYLGGVPRALDDTLNAIITPHGGGPPTLGMLLSGLDEMEVEVTTHGLTHPSDDPAPTAGGNYVVVE
jgi:hypothetical protein